MKWENVLKGEVQFEGNVVPQPYRQELLNFMPMNSVCAELGVKIGDFSMEILETVQPKEIKLVDIWKKENTFCKFLSNIIPYIKMQKTDINFLKASTDFAFNSRFLPKNYFDWIYIDADHSYDCVWSDILFSHSSVKIGGYITGDDYDKKEYPGVVEAVDKFIRIFRKNIRVHCLGENRQFILEVL